jgi:uncharacterized protein (UPF0216 family)
MRYIEATRRRTTPAVMAARGTEFRFSEGELEDIRHDANDRHANSMMLGIGLIWLLVIIFLLLGIAAFIKYLRS